MKNLGRIFIALFLFVSVYTFGQSADQERLENIVYELADDKYLGRGFGSEHGEKAADYIISEFEKSGVKPLLEEGYKHRFDYRSGLLNIIGNNVVAVVEGSDPVLKDEYIVIGAHYDHLGWEFGDTEEDTVVYNGADDNATGVAGVIELARIFQERKEFLGRSIIFVAFDGEESGLVGSGKFVDDEVVPLVNIAAMISIDMIGMYDTHEGVDIHGAGLFSDWDRLVAEAMEEVEIEITSTTSSVPDRTDTAPFGKAGVPCVHVFTGLESPYHEPEDDAELLEYKSMTDVVDFLAALVMEMSSDTELEASASFEKQAERGGFKVFNPGVTLNYGGSKHYMENNYFKAKGVFSASAGFAMMTRITKTIAFQPEVLYEWGGSQVAKPILDPDANGKLYTHGLSVPVSLLLTAGDEGGYSTTWFQFGGYYSMYFGGTENGNAIDWNLNRDTDYGLGFGFGIDAMGVRIGYYLKYSMLNFNMDPTNMNDVRLRATYFKVGYMF